MKTCHANPAYPRRLARLNKVHEQITAEVKQITEDVKTLTQEPAAHAPPEKDPN